MESRLQLGTDGLVARLPYRFRQQELQRGVWNRLVLWPTNFRGLRFYQGAS